MNPDADQLWRHLRWTLSQMTIYFGVAPIFGGLLVVHVDWHAIFWLLAMIGAALWALNWRRLPEALYAQQRHPFEVRSLMRGYWQLGADPRCLALSVAAWRWPVACPSTACSSMCCRRRPRPRRPGLLRRH